MPWGQWIAPRWRPLRNRRHPAMQTISLSHSAELVRIRVGKASLSASASRSPGRGPLVAKE